MTKSVKTGMTVKAFHPGMFGVIKHGTIVAVGSKYVRVDFGLGGTTRVPFKDIVEVLEGSDVEVGENLGTTG